MSDAGRRRLVTSATQTYRDHPLQNLMQSNASGLLSGTAYIATRSALAARIAGARAPEPYRATRSGAQFSLHFRVPNTKFTFISLS